MARQRIGGVATVAVMLMLWAASAWTVAMAATCDDQMNQLVNNCGALISGGKPSAACCGVIRAADFKCVCSKLTPEVARLINVQQLAQDVQQCGRSIPHHTRCGSVTIP